MEDYINIMKKYRIIVILYVIAFILILFFIWRPTKNNTSLLDISNVDEEQIYNKFYSYYKKELDQLFLEGNYEKIYNDYLLDDYKSTNLITLNNVEEAIKYKCQSFQAATSTKYTYDKSGDVVVYHVSFINENAENSLDIYEFSPYDIKIAFGKKVYNVQNENNAANGNDINDLKDNIKVEKNGLNFEITKKEDYDSFLKYDVKITNNDSIDTYINLIQNNNLVLVDNEGKYYFGSISINDDIKLEKGNYTTFTVSFNISLEKQSTVQTMRFTKIEKDGDELEIDIAL